MSLTATENPFAPVPPSEDGRKQVASPCSCAIGEICPHSWDYGIELERKNLKIKRIGFTRNWATDGYSKRLGEAVSE